MIYTIIDNCDSYHLYFYLLMYLLYIYNLYPEFSIFIAFLHKNVLYFPQKVLSS